MAFDVAGALREGYTKDEVADYLAKEQGFDAAGARSEGYSADDILSYLGAAPARQSQQPSLERQEPPDATFGSVARDFASGLLQIGPSAVKGAADLARLATGDAIGKDTSDAMESGMGAIRSVVGSERAAIQRKNFEADMANDDVGVLDALSRNKAALADQVLPALGSMVLPMGAAGAAGKIATVGRTAQALDKTALAARVASAQTAAGVGTNAALNAADTFAKLVDNGYSMEDAYVAAGITVPFSLIAGKLTGGGAEVAAVRALSGQGVKRGAIEVGKASLREGGQEIGETAGQITGEAVGTDIVPSATNVGKQLGVAGIIGSVVGGGVNIGSQVTAPVRMPDASPPAPEPTINDRMGVTRVAPADSPTVNGITQVVGANDYADASASIESLPEYRGLAGDLDGAGGIRVDGAAVVGGSDPAVADVAGPAAVAGTDDSAPGTVGVGASSQPLTIEKRADGTGFVRGDADTLAALLPDARGLATNGGTLVGKTRVADATAAVQAIAPVPESFASQQEADAFRAKHGLEATTVSTQDTGAGWLIQPTPATPTVANLAEQQAAVEALDDAVVRSQDPKALGNTLRKGEVEIVQPKSMNTVGGKFMSAVSRAVSAAFGIDVVLVRNLGSYGAYYEGRVFLDVDQIADSARNPRQVLGHFIFNAGHEVQHGLQKSSDPADQQTAATLKQVILAHLADKTAVDKRQADEQKLRTKTLPANYGYNEIESDLAGSYWGESSFWKRLGEVDNGSTARKVFYRFMQASTKLIAVMRGSKFDVSAMVTNRDAVREAFVQATAERMGRRAPKPAAGATQTGQQVQTQPALSSGAPVPSKVSTGQSPEGHPEFATSKVVIAFPQTTERFEVIPEPGQTVLNYAILPAAGEYTALGHVELLMQDGKPVSLLDIEVYQKGKGTGRAVIEALTNAFPDNKLNISNIVESARGFWASVGVPEQNRGAGEAYEGTLDAATVSAAARSSTQGRAEQARQPDAGRQGQSRRDAGTGQDGEVVPFSQTETPAFKRWFDGSVVVDKAGKPLVVYHGTPDMRFINESGVFSTMRERMLKYGATPESRKDADAKRAFFFTTSAKVAKTYADPRRAFDYQAADEGVVDAFLSIKNPLTLDAQGKHWREAQQSISKEDFVAKAKSDGYDGVVIRNVRDSYDSMRTGRDPSSDVYVAFASNQIKSASKNSGEFNPDNPDIRFSQTGPVYEPADVKKAEAYAAENGITPYISAKRVEIPVEVDDLPQFSQKLEGKYGNHPVLDIPLNKNGTVTLYFPTTQAEARRIAQEKTLLPQGDSTRIYLTNESSGWKAMQIKGGIEQPMDGSAAMVQVDPKLLHLDSVREDGRKDFFIPVKEGSYFKSKMTKLWSLLAPRDKAIKADATIAGIKAGVSTAIDGYNKLSAADKRQALKAAREVLKREHNVGTLLGVNGKLEKTNSGDYGLTYDGKSVVSMGLGMASAQRISEKWKTCPVSAICEALCLGDTSGQNLLYGGMAKGAGFDEKSGRDFRSGPRLSQYLKTEAFIVHPEEFAIVLQAEILSLEKWADKNDYAPSIRLNVTSDIPPDVWLPLINAHPGTMFYDYTKLSGVSVAPNHHLTYSSTGASQVINGKRLTNKHSNWDKMVGAMGQGRNVAMAFASRTALPKYVVDERTGEKFQVWNGDNYDARFLDPKPGDPKNEFGKGMIIGLTNKDKTGKPEDAAVKNDGFFIDYDPKIHGDTVTIPRQDRTISIKQAAAEEPAMSQADPYARYDGIQVRIPILIEDTGQTAHLRMDAGQALRSLDSRMETFRRTLECLSR
jgi:hypothetical protein